MRCEEVIHELSEPRPGRNDLAISRHLASCAVCALWAEQAAEFDRLWDATRPAEPSAEAWDHLWSSVTAQLDQPAHPTANGMRSIHSRVLPSAGSPAPSGRGRYWRGFAAVGIIGLAQAAALLIAVGISWRGPATAPSPSKSANLVEVAQNSSPSLDSEFEVEEGEVVLINSEGKKVRVDDLASQDATNGVDEFYLFLNVIEQMAKSVMAMTE